MEAGDGASKCLTGQSCRSRGRGAFALLFAVGPLGAHMNRGWFRFGVVLTLAWVLGLSAFATYEWQAPFYRKVVFFRVVPHPDQASKGGAIPVTTPFLFERFIAVLALPAGVLWVLLLVGPSFAWVRRGFKAQPGPHADPPTSGGSGT